MTAASRAAAWPSLPLEEWSDTCATLHLWMQIVGKVRLAQSPWINHSWHVTLYVTARGLTTSPIPHGDRAFEIDFDFVAHRLRVRSSDGGEAGFPLEPQTVATFHARLMEEMGKLGLHVKIHAKPNEIADPIPFAEDTTHRAYDREYAHRFWRVLVQAERVLAEFRARFIGKCSPVHLFWGAPDIAVTRFSGRAAPEHPGGIPNLPDWVTREAYSHEVSSCGFWAGGGRGLLSRVLLVRLSGTGRIRAGAGEAGGRLLLERPSRVHPALRRRPAVRRPGRHAARLPADDIRSRGQSRRLGPARAGTHRRQALGSRSRNIFAREQLTAVAGGPSLSESTSSHTTRAPP